MGIKIALEKEDGDYEIVEISSADPIIYRFAPISDLDPFIEDHSTPELKRICYQRMKTPEEFIPIYRRMP